MTTLRCELAYEKHLSGKYLPLFLFSWQTHNSPKKSRNKKPIAYLNVSTTAGEVWLSYYEEVRPSPAGRTLKYLTPCRCKPTSARPAPVKRHPSCTQTRALYGNTVFIAYRRPPVSDHSPAIGVIALQKLLEISVRMVLTLRPFEKSEVVKDGEPLYKKKPHPKLEICLQIAIFVLPGLECLLPVLSAATRKASTLLDELHTIFLEDRQFNVGVSFP
jgi:hypothetical protein